MGTIELKSRLHKIVEEIQDERILRALYSFLTERRHTKEVKMWDSLTEEQKKDVLMAYEESENDSNLISWAEVKKKLK